jgi:hypothetical protein
MKLNLFLVTALFFSATWICSAQVDPTVGTPTAAHNSALVEIPTAPAEQSGDPNSASSLTMGGEYKQPKNVIEQEKPVCWNWYADIGYTSQYNFRGTNLTPDADGALFINADVSKWGFTLGLFGIHQLGTARFPSFSAGEGGGGGSFGSVGNVGTYSPETVQTRFDELDVFLQYHHELGPIDVTVGNIGFFIERNAQTFLDTSVFGLYGPFPTVGNEQFDRLFIRLATSKIPYITPWITYYQTIYSEGQDHNFYIAPRIPPNPSFPPFVIFGRHVGDNFHERNDRLGGYLEGRVRGSFPIAKWVDFNPFGVISYSFYDRSEPVGPVPAPGQLDTRNFRDILRGRSLTGWNVAQVGLELPIHLLHFVGNSSGPCAPPDVQLDLVPGFTYSYHISTPTAGTDRNEVFGGAKIALTF